IAEIYGHVDELKAKYERKHISEADPMKRSSLIDEDTLKAIHDEVLESPPDPTEQTSFRTKLPSSVGAEIVGIGRDEAERVSARTLRSALCLSGGGIRSATFNLGILQGLARHG